MTTLEFILRRLMKKLGICNRLHHSKKVSKLSQKLIQSEINLGEIIWREISDIAELDDSYHKLKSLVNKEENIRLSHKNKLNENKLLKREAESIEDEADKKIKSLYKFQRDLSEELIGIKRKSQECETTCTDLRKKFINSTNEISKEIIEELKSQYTKTRQLLVNLKLKEQQKSNQLEKTQKELQEILNSTSRMNSEIMSKVSKSSKDVSSHTAEFEAIQSYKEKVYMKIGAFLFMNLNSEDPSIISIKEKFKIRPSESERLKRSIQYHHILAS